MKAFIKFLPNKDKPLYPKVLQDNTNYCEEFKNGKCADKYSCYNFCIKNAIPFIEEDVEKVMEICWNLEQRILRFIMWQPSRNKIYEVPGLEWERVAELINDTSTIFARIKQSSANEETQEELWNAIEDIFDNSSYTAASLRETLQSKFTIT